MEGGGKILKEFVCYYKEKIISINCIMRIFWFNLLISIVIVEEC